MNQTSLHGLLAQFDDPDFLRTAAERAYREGYRHMDAYTPFPVHGLAEALGFRGNRVPLLVLVGGLLGGLGGFFMQYYASAISYPLDVGGRPLNSWPAFIPVTFELTVLAASLAAVLGMLGLNRLPRPHHPVFNVDAFALASRNRFFLCIEGTDPQFEPTATRQFLEALQPQKVFDVPR